MHLLLTLVATVVAEVAYMALGSVLPALTFTQTLGLAIGLHVLAHWLITRHLTLTTATEVAVTVLLVDLVIHALDQHHDLLRLALHLVVVITAHLIRR